MSDRPETLRTEPADADLDPDLAAASGTSSDDAGIRPAAELPELPQTGDRAVDEALEQLVAVQHLPPAEQVETYVGTHRALQDRLADLEE